MKETAKDSPLGKSLKGRIIYYTLAGYAIMSAFSLGIVLLFVNSWQECSC